MFSLIVANPTVEYADKVIFSVFLLGLFFQMIFSAIFHTFCCVNPTWYLKTAKLDYAGIAAMIVGSYYAPMYYGFHCHPELGKLYLSLVTLLGSACVFVSLNSVFSTPRFRNFRLCLFIAFGFFGVFPIPHQIYLVGWAHVSDAVYRELAMGSLYLIGAVFYQTRYPESKYPRKWDMVSSHVFWHIFVLGAGIAQWYVSMYLWSHRQDTCPV
jgi:adiponectin receptor